MKTKESVLEKTLLETNTERLIEGYFYSSLPREDFSDHLKEKSIDFLLNMSDSDFEIYNFKNSKLITLEKSIKNHESPSYIHGNGLESISFYDFKKNGSYREIQIPNIFYYLSFCYNTLSSTENIFNIIYSESNTCTSFSNSYIMF